MSQDHRRDHVIVSYARKGRENYPKALPRLVDSALNAGYSGEFMIACPDHALFHLGPGISTISMDWSDPLGDHDKVPYGFKPLIIQHAKSKSYRQVLWCDSTIFFRKNPDILFDQLEKTSVLAFDNPGCPESHWTSDDCLAQIGCPIDQANFNQVMACVLGFNFDNDLGSRIFSAWFEIGSDGISFKGSGRSTRPEFRGHRHDQSVISYLVNKHSVEVTPYGTLSYWSDRDKFDSIVCNRGIDQP